MLWKKNNKKFLRGVQGGSFFQKAPPWPPEAKKGGKKMVRQGKFLMVIVLCFLFSVVFFGQGNQASANEKLREEIISVYKSRGEKGLQDFVKDRKDGISDQFIVNLAELGVKERNEEWLRVSVILAEEINDVETQTKVYYQMSKYFRLNQGNEKVWLFFNNSGDRLSQGDEYLMKGIIYFSMGDNLNALEMYEKALGYYKNAGDLCGLWWLYLYKGDIYYFKSDYSTALEMYKEAFLIYERIGDII
jgi:tetratricopeptide (TPR) repeat protein